MKGPPEGETRGSGFWHAVGRPGSVYFLAEALGKGGTYLVFVLLAGFMAVEDFGLLNVFVSLVTLAGVAVGLGLPDGVVRFHYRTVRSSTVLTLAFGTAIALGLLLTAVGWIWRNAVADALNVPVDIVSAVTCGAGLLAIRQVWMGALRARNETARYLAFRVVEPVAFALVLIWLIADAGGVRYGPAVHAYLAALAIVALWAIAVAARRVGFSLERGVAGPLLRYSVPLVAHSLAMTGIALFDQVVLQQLLGSDEVGIYAFAYRLGMAMTLVLLAFTNVWGPLVLKRMHANRGDSLTALAMSAFRWMFGIGVILSWTLPLIAMWIGGSEYLAAVSLVSVIIYGYLWMIPYSLIASILAFRDRSLALATVSGATFLLNALLNYSLVPLWGVAAAAWATVASYAVLTLLAYLMAAGDRALIPWPRCVLTLIVGAPFVLAPSLVLG